MSNLLRSLMMNEKIACFFWANSSFALLLTKNEWFALKNMTKIVYFDTLFKKNEQFAHSLFFDEQCEQITQVTHQKWVMWANCSGGSPKMSDHEWVAHQNDQMSKSIVFRANRPFAHYFAKNEQFTQKTDEQIPNPGEESASHTDHHSLRASINTSRPFTNNCRRVSITHRPS